MDWDKVIKNVKKGIAVTGEKIEEYSHIGKLKLDISISKRNKDRLCKDLGQKVYDLIQAGNYDLSGNQDVKMVIDKIKAAEEVIADLELRLKEALEKKPPKDA